MTGFEGRARADALVRQTLAIGADSSLPVQERLVRIAGLARRSFSADRSWLATAEVNAPGLGHTLAEDWDPEYPGVFATQEPVPLDIFRPQVDALRRAGRALLFCDPFPELGEEGRQFLRRYRVLAAAQVLAQTTRGGVRWLVGLDFCRARPAWGPEQAALLEEFASAAALVIESAVLLVDAEQARAQMEAVFDSLRDGVALLAPDGTVVRCNRAYAGLLGAASPEEVAGQNHAGLLGNRAGELACSIERLRNETEGTVLCVEERPAGPRWLECTVQRVARSPGELVHVLRDVTVQRLMDERTARREKLDGLGTLAGGVAHEFNNILMGMVPAVERVRRAASGDPEAVEIIAGAVERAGQVTRRMLALSRQQAGLVGRADLAPTLHEVVAVLRSSLPKNIQMELAIEGVLGWVGLEAGSLHSILINLATNARDAMPSGGRLCIAARVEGGAEEHAVVEVTDTGVGIAPGDLPRIFDPFFTGKPPGEGTGLGLALVHRLVTDAGGSITAHSAGPGAGARFVIRLPLVPPAAAAAAKGEGAAPARLDRVRVLLVDDEPLIRDGIAGLLGEAGARVISCGSAEEALMILATEPEPFAAAVVDYGLPGMDGGHLIGELLDTDPGLAVALASGYTDFTGFASLLERGVGFFQKPFEVSALIRWLAAAVAERRLHHGISG